MPSIRLEELPVIMKGDTARGAAIGWNGMKVGHFQIQGGTDITEALYEKEHRPDAARSWHVLDGEWF